MEKFFFVNSSSSSENSSLCIGEIQLIWTVKSEPQEPLSSLRLYFMPEQSPGGRQHHHGQDELLAAEDKIIIRVKDLISWLVVENVPWTGGSVLPAHLCDAHQSTQSIECPIVIISYPKYCRLVAMKKRLESTVPSATISNGNALSAVFTAALRTTCSINADLTSQTRIMFCRSTFGHPDLDDHKLRCDHLAPNLKGRPRSKHRGALKTEPDTEYVPLNAVPLKPKRGRPRKGVISVAMLRAEGPFLKAIYSFMKDRGTPIHRIPSLGFKKIDLFDFYKTAEKLGGYKQICSKRMWKVLHDKIGGNPGSTSAATCTRKHYERLLLPFEEHLRSAGSGRASSSSKAAMGFPNASHKPKPPPAQPSVSTCADRAAGAARQQLHTPGQQRLSKEGGGAAGSLAATPRAAGSAGGGDSGAKQQQQRHQPAKRRHAVLSTVTPGPPDGGGGGSRGGSITVPGPDGWLFARRHAVTGPQPPLPLLGSGAELPGSPYDLVGRQPGEQLLEAVLRTASLPTAGGGLLPGLASGQLQQLQQQQRHHHLHQYHQHHGGGVVSSGSRPAAMPSSDGHVLLTAASGQLLSATREQLLVAASSSSLIFGRHQGGELPHRRQATATDACGRATAVPLLQPQQRRQQLVAATGGCHAARSSLPPPYFSTPPESRLLSSETQTAAKRSRLDAAAAAAAVPDSGCKVMAAVAGRPHQVCGTGSDVPLDLTCKPALKTVTEPPPPLLLGGSRPRKQLLSCGREQQQSASAAGATSVVATSGRGIYSVSAAPVNLATSVAKTAGPCQVPGRLPTQDTAMAATQYDSYVASSPPVPAPKPSHQRPDSHQLGLGDYASSLQRPAASGMCVSGGGSAAGVQLADAPAQASQLLAALHSESSKAIGAMMVASGAASPAAASAQPSSQFELQAATSVAAQQGKRYAAPPTVQHYVHPLPASYPYAKQH